MIKLTEEEEGILTAYHVLKSGNAPIPDDLQLRVWEIWEKHPEKHGRTLIKGPIGPWG